MEEKQEGPEGKQTSGVTGATISPSTSGACLVARALTSEKQGLELSFVSSRTIYYDIFKPLPYKMDCQYCNAC